MKLIFVNDHIFLKKDNEYYTSGSLTANVIKRYIDIFGNITLVTRVKDVTDVKEGLAPSSIDKSQFVRVPNFKSLTKLHKFITAKKIIKEQVKESDFVIARTSSLAHIAIKYAKKFNKPYLIEVVGCPWDSTWNYSMMGKLIAPISYIKTRIAVKQAPYCLYVTSEFLQQRYPSNGKTIGCSDVSIPKTDQSVLEKRKDKIQNIKKGDPIVIGTIGNVNVRYKGQQFVIKAISKLIKFGYNFEYHLVGGGDNGYLKDIAREYGVLDKIKFIGSIPHNEVFDFLDNIDVYVQPSKTEGLPRALIEAMSRGCYSIGSRVGGIPELLEEDYTFSKGSVDEICDKLMNIDREKLINGAIKNFQKSMEYEESILIKRRNDFYQLFKKSSTTNLS